MTADIQIGSDTIRMCGNAATPIRYKGIFHRDLMMTFKGMTADMFEADIVKELAFVMAQQARGADWKQVTFDDYVSWLEAYEEMDILSKSAEIIALWVDNSETTVKNKKK